MGAHEAGSECGRRAFEHPWRGGTLDLPRPVKVIEVSERWRCPSTRVVFMARRHGVAVVASTDSHRAADVGRYAYVAETSAQLDAALHAAT